MPASAGQLVDTVKGVDAEGSRRANINSTAVNTRGLQGDTALHWAAFHGRQTLVEQLIARGADINTAVNNGNTPLHQAAYRGHNGVVELLIVNGADVNSRTRSGITPLDWAKRNGHRAVVQTLLAHGGRYGTASGFDSNPVHTQTETASRRTDTLPDAVLFAALGHLPSLPDKPRPVSASAHHSQGIAAFRVQLAAMRDEGQARAMWQQYLSRYPAILTGLQPSVVAAHVNGLPFYRIQGGPLTEDSAHRVCEELRRDNQACLIVKVSRNSG